MCIKETVEQAIALCNNNPELSLDNVALYITYKGTQYKLKGKDCLEDITQTPILDREDWQDYFHTDIYLGASNYEIIAGLYYKSQGYEVYVSKQSDLADRQGIDLVVIDPKTNNKCLVQVKGRCYQNSKKNRGRELKYKLFNIEVFTIDIDKFTTIVEDTPINKFLQDIFLGKRTNANLWSKIDLPSCEFQIKQSKAFKYQIQIVDTLKSKGIYAVPVTDKQIAYYNFVEGKWTFVQANSANYKEVSKNILKEVFKLEVELYPPLKDLQRSSTLECTPNIAAAIPLLKRHNFSVLPFNDNHIGIYHTGKWNYVKVSPSDSTKDILNKVLATQEPVADTMPNAWKAVIKQLEKEENITIIRTTRNRVAIKKGDSWIYQDAHPQAKPQTLKRIIKDCLARSI